MLLHGFVWKPPILTQARDAARPETRIGPVASAGDGQAEQESGPCVVDLDLGCPADLDLETVRQGNSGVQAAECGDLLRSSSLLPLKPTRRVQREWYGCH